MPKNHQAENLRGQLLATLKGFVVMLVTLAFIAGVAASLNPALAQQRRGRQSAPGQAAQSTARALSEEIMLRIVRAEDERRWDGSLSPLLSDRSARVRRRAALAAGRIGDERAVPSLVTLLQTDRDAGVRAMAAFALGEVEAASGADALMAALNRAAESGEVRARVIEAIGKIAAALPKTDEARTKALGEAVVFALDAEAARGVRGNRRIILEGLTAALRAAPSNAAPTLAKFLSHKDARIRADAANALARLRTGEANEQVRPHLTNDTEAIVRANAARVLGVSEDKAALDALVERAVGDTDERVRVSSIRALYLLKDVRGAAPLLGRVTTLFAAYTAARAGGGGGIAHPREAGELLELATTLSRLLANTGDQRAVGWLKEFRLAESMSAPEIEIAFARIAPAAYLREDPFNKISDEATRARLRSNWRVVSSVAQGLGEIGGITAATAGSGVVRLQADAQIILRGLLDDAAIPSVAVPDVLRALAAFKSTDVAEVLRKQLGAKDAIVRATAAELLGELGPDEANARALIAALRATTGDELNDAALSILDALGKQKSAAANEAIKTALDSTDHLLRRRAVALLKANDAGDFSSRIGLVATRNTLPDYRRALARREGRWRATVATDKGSFVIELLPEDAPLTVDNFVQLARRGYFNNLSFHRVVPNFVIQGGDPRGDGNGGPGYQIRCEINEVEYERGAVGMALSGKDTGGSQWFVTHSPQPHLDGGYTVFGRVVAGLDVVDAIERGDLIRSITVTEGPPPASKPASKARRRQHR
ncbi:MAG TPA: peptidylprolyl isomerase [Pyrinomonadaceae bacterium]|jgi:cyclophilin family peptidyl-prolyl cis-trans isomerase/HEAT repeat protein|nr:peptidylprolyl isomerase [Pyrinomonadaceae bacterium]